MTNVLHFLEVICGILNHELEAASIAHAILFIDEVVNTTGNAASLVGREDKHLGDLGPVSVHA